MPRCYICKKLIVDDENACLLDDIQPKDFAPSGSYYHKECMDAKVAAIELRLEKRVRLSTEINSLQLIGERIRCELAKIRETDSEYSKEEFELEKSETPSWADVSWEDVDPNREIERRTAIEDQIKELDDMYPNGNY
tara:strand:- start:773 stop:1183 length:411 start_codon:yes stop_codon:yes gene_type:complete